MTAEVRPAGLEATSVVELAVCRLRSEILSGALAPGERLIEEQLRLRFGTSRPAAAVTTLFGYPNGAVEARQSRTWVRFAPGRRIVAAHVSELPVGPYAATGRPRWD